MRLLFFLFFLFMSSSLFALSPVADFSQITEELFLRHLIDHSHDFTLEEIPKEQSYNIFLNGNPNPLGVIRLEYSGGNGSHIICKLYAQDKLEKPNFIIDMGSVAVTVFGLSEEFIKRRIIFFTNLKAGKILKNEKVEAEIREQDESSARSAKDMKKHEKRLAAQQRREEEQRDKAIHEVPLPLNEEQVKHARLVERGKLLEKREEVFNFYINGEFDEAIESAKEFCKSYKDELLTVDMYVIIVYSYLEKIKELEKQEDNIDKYEEILDYSRKALLYLNIYSDLAGEDFSLNTDIYKTYIQNCYDSAGYFRKLGQDKAKYKKERLKAIDKALKLYRDLINISKVLNFPYFVIYHDIVTAIGEKISLSESEYSMPLYNDMIDAFCEFFKLKHDFLEAQVLTTSRGFYFLFSPKMLEDMPEFVKLLNESFIRFIGEFFNEKYINDISIFMKDFYKLLNLSEAKEEEISEFYSKLINIILIKYCKFEKEVKLEEIARLPRGRREKELHKIKDSLDTWENMFEFLCKNTDIDFEKILQKDSYIFMKFLYLKLRLYKESLSLDDAEKELAENELTDSSLIHRSSLYSYIALRLLTQGEQEESPSARRDLFNKALQYYHKNFKHKEVESKLNESFIGKVWYKISESYEDLQGKPKKDLIKEALWISWMWLYTSGRNEILEYRKVKEKLITWNELGAFMHDFKNALALVEFFDESLKVMSKHVDLKIISDLRERAVNLRDDFFKEIYSIKKFDQEKRDELIKELEKLCSDVKGLNFEQSTDKKLNIIFNILKAKKEALLKSLDVEIKDPLSKEADEFLKSFHKFAVQA